MERDILLNGQPLVFPLSPADFEQVIKDRIAACTDEDFDNRWIESDLVELMRRQLIALGYQNGVELSTGYMDI